MKYLDFRSIKNANRYIWTDHAQREIVAAASDQ